MQNISRNKNAFSQKPTTNFGIEIQILTLLILNALDFKIILTLRLPWLWGDLDFDVYINTIGCSQ